VDNADRNEVLRLIGAEKTLKACVEDLEKENERLKLALGRENSHIVELETFLSDYVKQCEEEGQHGDLYQLALELMDEHALAGKEAERVPYLEEEAERCRGRWAGRGKAEP